MEAQDNTSEIVELTADIVAAYVSNNSVAAGDVSGLIADVHKALVATTDPAAVEETEPQKPAVSVRRPRAGCEP